MVEYLATINDATLRLALVDSLRANRKAATGLAVPIERQQIVYTAMLNLAKVPGIFWSTEAVAIAAKLDGAYNSSSKPGEMRDVARIEAALWALITAGLAYPRFQSGTAHKPEQYPWVMKYLVLTDLGERYLDQDILHPVAPDFITNAISGLSDLPLEVRAALEDAQLCFQHRLLRASIVQLGLAYEVMASEIYDVIVGGNKGPKPTKAKQVLKKIEQTVEALNDEAASRAVTVADEIRAARNTAAHNWKHDFRDIGEVETLLILGGRNVATFWGLHGS